jgi:hypothetical protein
MKTLFLNSVLVFAFAFTVLSCSNDDDDNSNSSTDTNQTNIENTVQAGTWMVTKFIDSGEDETNNFSGYSFTFNDNNTLVATNGTNSYDGSWSITDSNSSDDSIDDLDFNISFTTPSDFEELTEDWDIISRTDTKIELIHISGGNGGTDYLTFEKN